MDATEKYIAEHKKVFSLRRISQKPGKPRTVVGWSIAKLLRHNMKSILTTSLRYPIELFRAREFLIETWLLRDSEKKRKCLVIGNGPSQGFLTVEELDEFKSYGGQTFCINFWPQNRRLSKHVPSWMIFSDPDTFSPNLESAHDLIGYIKENSSIKLAVPAFMLSRLDTLNFPNKVYCFADTELSIWKNINPLFPRGYISMTLYKALAWATHLGFSEIGVIGMDNTFPRNIYNDHDNRICKLETHSGVDDYLTDNSSLFTSVAAHLDNLVPLFQHLEYFPVEKIVNLDIYSLTDAFKKVELKDFLNSEKSG